MPRREHGHDYLRVEKGKEDESASMRQAHAAAHCHEHYSQEADWMINLDIDEYVWSPAHEHLPDFFALEVPPSLHIMYVGATRFGWGGQRRRFTYTLEPVSPPTLPTHACTCLQSTFSFSVKSLVRPALNQLEPVNSHACTRGCIPAPSFQSGPW